MSDRITSETFRTGDRIFSEGEPGHHIYVIRQGTVRISRLEEGIAQVLADLGPGNVIGEMAVVSESQRSASATALTECVLSVIPKEEIDRRIDDADPILKILLLTAFERIRSRAAHSYYHRPAGETSSPKPDDKKS